jgi:hypothetical protein
VRIRAIADDELQSHRDGRVLHLEEIETSLLANGDSWVTRWSRMLLLERLGV